MPPDIEYNYQISWIKIIDENLKAPQSYFNNLSPQCFGKNYKPKMI